MTPLARIRPSHLIHRTNPPSRLQNAHRPCQRFHRKMTARLRIGEMIEEICRARQNPESFEAEDAGSDGAVIEGPE
ncbi:hypothetical protein L596_029546 [Steinernema carpocapsae]|uniref:Uncharacterized protein n=1 Tax=Steinernema carpocapsae TaxID=34508 RepID=A0A4U5LUZ1_STECR|nr:hypothetical protein L596_029546 [Steinernema carpocapsae]